MTFEHRSPYGYGWRFDYPVSLVSYLFYLYSFSFVGFGALLTFLNVRKKNSPSEKGILFISFVGLMFVIFLTMAFDIILPAFQIERIPNFCSNIILLVWVLTITYAISRYKLFSLTPLEAAEGIAAMMNDGLLLVNAEGMIRWTNKATYNLLGFRRDELINQPLQQVFKFTDDYRKVTQNASMKDFETTLETRQKIAIPVSLSKTPIVDRKSKLPKGEIYVCRDISDRKYAESELKKSLLEKETLLREIHHRVKNNMQIILSMLKINIRNSENREVIKILETTLSRIETMSLIHNILHLSDNIKYIHLSQYVERIIAAIQSLTDDSESNIQYEVNCDDTHLEIDKAIPCGLIINEIVFNSIKHAFPDNRQGKITVDIKSDEDANVTVIVDDNGIGMNESLEIDNPTTLGLSLIKLLAENQLQGSIGLNRTYGTCYKIRFKIK